MNALLKRPTMPPWADGDQCDHCGAQYADFTAGISWCDGAQRVRHANQDNDGGYRTRGPVLWAMHILKLEAWVEEHMFCQPPPNLDEPECEAWRLGQCEERCPWCPTLRELMEADAAVETREGESDD